MSIRAHYASFALLSVAMFTIAGASLVVLGIGAEVTEALGLPPGSAGYLITSFALPYAILAPMFQFLIGGRIGPRTAIVLGGLILGCGLLLSGIAQSGTVLFAARGITAIGAALVTPAALAAAVELALPEERGRAIAIVFLGFTLASLIGVPLGTQITLVAGWRATFYVFAAAAVVTSAMAMAILPSLAPSGSQSLAKSVRLLSNLPLLATFGAAIFQLASQFVFLAAMAPILVHHFELPQSHLPAVLAGFGIAGVIGNHLAGVWSDRAPLRAPLRISMIGLTVTLFVLSFEVNAYIAAALFASIAFFGTLFRPPQIVLLSRIADPDDRGLVFGFNTSASYIGLTIGSFASALTIDAFGYTFLGAVAIALLLPAMLLLKGISHEYFFLPVASRGDA